MKITVSADGVLLDLLRERYPDSSRTTLRQWLQRERVLVDGAVTQRADTPVHAGQVIEITSVRKDPVRPPCEIIYRDDRIIAVSKPAGLLSVGRDRPGEDTLHRRINVFVQATSEGASRAFIVHRLDQLASGVMVFALDPSIQETLQRAWELTEKRYWAVVEGRPDPEFGTIRTWLQEDRNFRVHSVPESPDADFAVTHYRVSRPGPHRSLLEVRIDTGRKHQIRVHLSELGHPIIGDQRYGARTDPIHRLGLHAFFLAFPHPVTGARVELRSPRPAAFVPG